MQVTFFAKNSQRKKKKCFTSPVEMKVEVDLKVNSQKSNEIIFVLIAHLTGWITNR